MNTRTTTPATASAPSVTFAVDDVAPARSPLKTCKPPEAVRALLDAPPGRFAADESGQGNPTHGRVEACWSYAADCVAGVGHHPLVAAAHLAFSGHRPLALSPDVIWVTIVQGLAQHVRLDPEAYRTLLVRHDGRRRLTVRRDDLHRGSPENPWAEVVADFAGQVRREAGEVVGRFACDFSTTGPVERTASEVALLDVVRPYFSYHVVCVCGIPAVTLEGTPADWRSLRAKVELLAPFGLDWWLGELRPICDQFARAAAGDVDRDHWRRLYKVRAVYGAEVMNGWLGKLFPYVKDFDSGTYSERNDLLDPAVEAEIRRLEAEDREQHGRDERRIRFHAPGIGADQLPRGLSRVPFTLSDGAGDGAMEFVAGAMVVTQDGETGALRPTLGWAVREAAPIEQAIARLADHQFKSAAAGPTWEALRALRLDYLPTDVLRFYQEFEGGSIRGADGVPLYRILPLAEWAASEWGQKRRGHPGPGVDPDDVCRFAEAADGTELLIRHYCPERKTTGAVYVGQRAGAPAPVAETGRKVARSFTDFLLRALDGGPQPYFRQAGFVTPS